MNNKKINFYYSTKDNNGEPIHRCLYEGCHDIVSVDALDYKKQKNIRMNSYYTCMDDDLFKFRDDLHKHNDEIRKIFFKSKTKEIFKVDALKYNTINDAVYNNVLINSDQKTINTIPDIKFREFVMFENCSSCGLMSVNKDILEIPMDVWTCDYSKYYFYMMKKIRIPTCAPVFYVIDEINFDKLDFGYYRCKVICSNKQFWNIFKFNDKHHYSHNTLKLLYKYRERYGIKFKLLEPDKCYNYNMVHYETTVELKVLFKEWFKVMEKLLKDCSKSNWLVKAYVSQAWGTICSYNKIYVHKDDSESYYFDQLNKISNKKYDYYSYEYSDSIFTMIDANKPFKHGGLARIKPFLTEFARGYMFNMVSENNLEGHVLRVQTDSVSFNRSVDFKILNMAYYPIPESKSTGYIVFHNINSYYHVCKKCDCQFKYNKDNVHKCINC